MGNVVFPAFLQLKYESDGTAKGNFLNEVGKLAEGAEQRFKRSFDEIGAMMGKSLSGFKGGDFKFSLDVSGLRQTAAEADHAVQRLTLMRNSAIALATATDDNSESTREYLQALRAQIAEAERAKQTADAQVATYTRLQAEIDRSAAAQERLAASYRATYLEQARSVNAAHASQQAVNTLTAPGLTSRATDNGAGFAALDAMVRDQEAATAALARYKAEALGLRQALDPAIAIQQRFDVEMERADRLLAAGAISAREYAAAQRLATDNLQSGWTALTRSQQVAGEVATRSISAQRFASVQLGQQLQDSVVQAQMGTALTTILVQQGSQAAFALSALEGKVGAAARVIAGPWGAAILAGTAVLGPIIAKVLGFGNESETATKKAYDFARGLDVLTISGKQSADAMQQLADATKAAISAQGDYLANQAAIANDSVAKLEKRIGDNQRALDAMKREAEQNAGNPFFVPGYSTMGRLQEELTTDRAALESARQAQANAELALSQRQVNDSLDAATAATNRYAAAVGELNARRDRSKKLEQSRDVIGAQLDPKYISEPDYRREFDRLTREKNAAVAAAQAAKREASTSAYEKASFDLPVNGPITSGFGPRARPTAGASTNHPAIDIAVPVGTAVRAPQVGTVEAVGFDPGLGKFIVINHGAGTTTRYAHLSDNSLVTKGERVDKGDVIAKTGNTGTSTGPHLDYQVRVNGKPVDPRKGVFPIDSTQVAEAAQRSASVLQQFGASASESIQRINEQFDDQPKLVDQAAAATRKLKELYDGLSSRNLLTPELEKRIKDAQALASSAVSRQIAKQASDSAEQLRIQELIATGYDREAAAAQAVFQAHKAFGDNVLPKELAAVQAIARAEYDRGEAMKRQQEMAGHFLDASRSIKGEIEAIFAGEGSFKNFGQIFKRLNAQVVTEQIFGGMFRDIDKWVKQHTPLDDFMQSTGKAGDALTNFASTAVAATERLAGINSGPAASVSFSGAANDNARVGARGIGGSIVNAAGLALSLGGGGKLDSDGSILVEAAKSGKQIPVKMAANTVAGMSPEIFAQQLGRAMGDVIGGQLSQVLGPSLGRTLGGIIGGAYGGNLLGGTPGAVIGALRELPGMPKQMEKVLTKGLEGAQTGSLIAGISNSLGLKMSNTGAQIGGAIGSAIPIPGGQIIGSILGGLVGGLFSKTKQGYAVVSNSGVTSGGNSSELQKQQEAVGSSIQSTINSIAERLGGTVGNYAVSIAQRSSGWIHVDGSGASNVGDGSWINKAGSNAVYNGKDPEAALRSAIANAIQDGAIQGIRAGSQRLLRAAKDIDQGVQDALDFESIFTRLKSYTDPVGAALDALDKEFAHYRDLAIAAGEGMAEVEQLYGKERVKVIEQANQQILGSLKNLYSSLTVGDSGLSLRERQSNAKAAYDPLAARVAAGDVSAYDSFATAAQTLLDVSRQLYGSQDQYFSIFDQIRDLTKTTIDKQSDIAAIAAGRDSPFSSSTVPNNDNAAVVSAIDAQTQALIAALTAQGYTLSAMNDNIGALLQQGAANGTTGINLNFAGGYW